VTCTCAQESGFFRLSADRPTEVTGLDLDTGLLEYKVIGNEMPAAITVHKRISLESETPTMNAWEG